MVVAKIFPARAHRPLVVICKLLPLAVACALLPACAEVGDVAGGGKASQIVVSVQDQKMTVIREGGGRVSYPISTSKFGLDGHRRSFTTPTGNLEIAQKVGGGAPEGAVFKSRVRTGEIVKVDAPSRDAIVTRILVLRGLDGGNRDASSRGIYIHGTPEERNIGTPASYGCIRMRSRDVVALYDMVGVGTRVRVLDSTQRGAVLASGVDLRAKPPAEVTASLVAANTSTSVPAPVTAAETSPGASAVEAPPIAAPAPAPAVTAPASKPTSKPATVQVVTNLAGNNGKWAGSPGKLLSDQPAANVTPVVPTHRAPAPVSAAGGGNGGARPVANSTADAPDAGRALRRSALDSL